MATDIFDKGFSDHVVFDRIVDVDRTITLARQAADEAEKRGQPEKAAKLREKADYLEEILNNTQNPDYSDEEEGTPPAQSNGGEGVGKGKDSGQGNKSDTGDNDTGEGEEEKDSEEPDTTGKGSGREEKEEKEEGDGEGSGSGGGGEEKQPEDIANLDQSNGKHASGTNQHQGGGPSGSGQGGGGGSQGSGTSNPQNQGQGQGKGQGYQGPFIRIGRSGVFRRVKGKGPFYPWAFCHRSSHRSKRGFFYQKSGKGVPCGRNGRRMCT